MKKYVLGFMFSDLFETEGEVALIRKTKPEWQKGKLNGIGGKIEDDESPISAMIREFYEETGRGTDAEDWKYCGNMIGKDWTVDVYACFGNLSELETTTDEEVVCFELPEVFQSGEVIDNLKFLIPMSLHVLAYEAITFNILYPEHE